MLYKTKDCEMVIITEQHPLEKAFQTYVPVAGEDKFFRRLVSKEAWKHTQDLSDC